MPPGLVARRAAQIRDLLKQGAFVGLRVPLGNGGTLPAEMFATIALDDFIFGHRAGRPDFCTDVRRR